MKFIKKTLFLALASLAILSCSNLETTDKTQTNGDTASISFNVEPVSARTIMPTITLSSYTYSVTGKMKGTTEVQTLLTKQSYTKLTNTKAITVKLGEWEFTVTAYDGDNVVLSGTASAKITINTNTIDVVLTAAGSGTGSVKVSVGGIPNAVTKVTAKLYDSMEAAATDSGTEQTISSGNVVFTKENVAVNAGTKEWFVKFFFYDAQGACVKTFTESVYVVAGKESSKAVYFNNFNMFKVLPRWQKDGSQWNDPEKAVALRKNGRSYTFTFNTSQGAWQYTEIPGGTYNIYINDKDTGVTFAPDVDNDGLQNIDLDFYTVTVKAGDYTVASDAVLKGSAYSFNLENETESYCSIQNVKLGEDVIEPVSGVYTINNVTSALTVSVNVNDHAWDTGVLDGDKITYTCGNCSNKKEFTKGVAIAATAADVNAIINSLPENDSFVYNIILTGNINAALITSLETILKNENRLVALDMSAATGLTSIDSMAFMRCTSLADIKLPNTVTEINSNVFARCTNLTSVTLNNVTKIGSGAFDNCEKLASITIPASVEIIDGAFRYCTNLASVTFEAGSKLTEIGWGTFTSSSITSIEIPAGVTTIKNEAFNNCRKLASVVIPASVNELCEQAFYYCDALETLTVKAATPPTVGNKALYNLKSSIKIYVPSGSVSAYQAAAG